MNAEETIQAARKHIGKGIMASSAKVCLEDAVSLLAEGREDYAKTRALKSLAYSVGMSHEDYIAAK